MNDNYKNIKIRKITKQKIYLYVTFTILFLLTIYTFVTMDFGGVNIKIATKSLLKDLKLMFFAPRLSERYTFLEVLNNLVITIALAVLSTIIGSITALFLAFFSAKNLASEKSSKIYLQKINRCRILITS